MVVFGIVLHDVNVGVWQVSTAVLSITAKAKKKEKEKKEKEEEKMEVVRQHFQKRNTLQHKSELSIKFKYTVVKNQWQSSGGGPSPAASVQHSQYNDQCVFVWTSLDVFDPVGQATSRL